MKNSNVQFHFLYPVNKKKVDIYRAGGWRFDHITDLLVSGSGYKLPSASARDPIEDRYDFHIESVVYEGCDVLPLLEAFDVHDELESASLHHIHHLFTGEPSAYNIPVLKPGLNPFPLQKIPIK